MKWTVLSQIESKRRNNCHEHGNVNGYVDGLFNVTASNHESSHGHENARYRVEFAYGV